jgi:anti-anti-sigma factor
VYSASRISLASSILRRGIFMCLDSDSILNAPDLAGKPLEIGIARRDGAVVISLGGELDLAGADDLARCLRDAEATAGRLVIDLSDLFFIDSTGLQALLGAKSRSNGQLTFIPSKHEAVTRVLALTQTDDLLGL